MSRSKNMKSLAKEQRAEIEREALKLLSLYIGRPFSKVSNPDNFDGWVDGCFHRQAEYTLKLRKALRSWTHPTGKVKR